jgi:hypothetical protein
MPLTLDEATQLTKNERLSCLKDLQYLLAYNNLYPRREVSTPRPQGLNPALPIAPLEGPQSAKDNWR